MKELLWYTLIAFTTETIKQKHDTIVGITMRCRQEDNHSSMMSLKWMKVFNMVFGQTNHYIYRSSFMQNDLFMRHPDMK